MDCANGSFLSHQGGAGVGRVSQSPGFEPLDSGHRLLLGGCGVSRGMRGGRKVLLTCASVPPWAHGAVGLGPAQALQLIAVCFCDGGGGQTAPQSLSGPS